MSVALTQLGLGHPDSEKNICGTAPHAKATENFNINCIPLANLKQEKTHPLSKFTAPKQSASEHRHQTICLNSKSGGMTVTKLTKN